ncbi:acyltransferase domain-containing protein [Actinoplanes sp. NPDC026619]|uniref:acyltransferase domain-containing protein n=1 Tax=Actinoplanes sp. NPDC026619 TaxID=3155798 RepID=UPI0033E81706
MTAGDAGTARPMVPWVLSARSPASLRGQATRLLAAVSEPDELDPAAIGSALASTRSRFEHRVVVLGTGRPDLTAGVAAFAHGERSPAVIAGPGPGPVGGTAFLFPGQGSQYIGMGRELYRHVKAFAEALDEVCAALDPHLDRPLTAVLFAADGALLERTVFTQPALFAVEVALARLLDSWGVRPDYLIGHSVGELAAAHVAGVLTLPAAAELIAARGRAMEAAPAGAMAQLRATAAEVEESLATLGGEVSLAARNAPEATVVSGARDAVEKVVELWRGRGRRADWLPVRHAFHSAHLDGVLTEFAAVARGLSYRPPAIPIVSNVGGELDENLTDPSYWVRQVREPVRFHPGIVVLQHLGVSTFVEVGPGQVLSSLAAQCALPGLAARQVTLATLRPEAERTTLVAALAELFVRDHPVDWRAVLGEPPGPPAQLPTYAFDHRHYWLLPEPAGEPAAAGLDPVRHPVLRHRMDTADGATVIFSGRLSLATNGWLAGHTVAGAAWAPATFLVELALRAAGGALRELVLQAPLVLPEQGVLVVQVTVHRGGALVLASRVEHAEPDERGGWSVHATGSVGGLAPPPVMETSWPPAGAVAVDAGAGQERLAAAGFGYGPAFRGLRAVWQRGDEVFAEVEAPSAAGVDPAAYGLHPALLDAVLQAWPVAVPGVGAVVPFSWEDVSLHQAGAGQLRARLSPAGERAISIAVADGAGHPVLAARAIRMRQLPTGAGVAPSLGRAAPAPTPGDEPDLRHLLAAIDPAERQAQALRVVGREVAAVLGHGDDRPVDPYRSFRDQGFDSLTAVELRDALAATTGVPLPATVVFDHPTPVALADHLCRAVLGEDPIDAMDVEDLIEAALATGGDQR